MAGSFQLDMGKKPEKPSDSPGSTGPAYTPAELAALLTKAGLGPVTAEQVEADVAAGLPTANGKIHPVQYAAWLNGAARAD